MALVLIASLFMALLLLIFKVFERRNIPLLPAIVVNYFTAFTCGCFFVHTWEPAAVEPLLPAVLALGALFIGLFYLTGLSIQRAGMATTSVATKMSLVLTVLFAVIVFAERPGILGWVGILFALVAVVLTSLSPGSRGAKGALALPFALFIGNAAIDVLLNTVQRTLLTTGTESLFPTLIFGVAGTLGTIAIIVGHKGSFLRDPRVIIGGVVLGIANYASLYFIVSALARSGYAASSVFPLMNIGVILFGTLASILFFGERVGRVQWLGIGLSIIAMVLILCN